MKHFTLGLGSLAVVLLLCLQAQTTAQKPDHRAVLDRYCVTCHNERVKTANLMLDKVDVSNPGANAEVWEKVMRKVHTGTMPPPNIPQLAPGDRQALLTWLESTLDAAAAKKPNPGRTETLRRLNRTEYQNAVRDLLALDIDAASLLPADESGHGFDNVNVGDLPPTLLDRYISAAQKISRLAIGSTQTSMQADTIRLPADRTQETHVAGLPLGTRGGISIPYTFARDGEYEIQIRLARDRNEVIEGFFEAHQIEVSLDGAQLQVVYGVEGERDLTERTFSHLAGFEDSRPVRVGNAVWTQRQLDVVGEVLASGSGGFYRVRGDIRRLPRLVHIGGHRHLKFAAQPRQFAKAGFDPRPARRGAGAGDAGRAVARAVRSLGLGPALA